MKRIITLLLLTIATAASAQETKVAERAKSQSKDKKYIISVSIGPSYRVAKAPSGLTTAEEDYFGELKIGLAYDVSAYYVQDESIGYGLRYSSFSSSGSSYNPDILDPNEETGAGIQKDAITITFYGLGVLLQDSGFSPNDKISLEVALGYIRYANDARFLYNYKLTGGNLGVSSTIAYQFALSESISIGPSISFTGGMMKKLHIKGNDLDKTIEFPGDNLESLYRFDLSATARLRF